MVQQIDRELINSKPKCYIFDIDGCLANTNNIILSKFETFDMKKQKYETERAKYQAILKENPKAAAKINPPKEPEPLKSGDSKKFDWEYFEEHLQDAEPIWGVIDMFIALATTHKVILLTGRKERHRTKTTAWLEQVVQERAGKEAWRRINFSLMMREDKNNEPSAKFKKAKFLAIEKTYNIQLIVEDHPDVLEVINELGFTSLKPNTVFKQIGDDDRIKKRTTEIKAELIENDPKNFKIDHGVKENEITL